MASIPPAPIYSPQGSYQWEDWYRQLRDGVQQSLTSVTWGQIDFTGSNLTDVVTRDHNSLTNIQGGTSAEYYHLTSTQKTRLTAIIETNPTASAATTTHKVPININGTNYYILLSNV